MQKLFRLGYKIIKSNFQNLSKPYKLTYAVTYNCNSRCMHCNIWKRKSRNELSLKDIDRFFKKNDYFSWIDLTGGEIFNRRDIVEVASIITKRSNSLYLLHFPTNAETEAAYKKTREILNLTPNLLIVSISLDGPEIVHDNIRGIKGSWKKSINLYKRLSKLNNKKLKVYFGYTLSGLNYDKLNDTISSIKMVIPDFEFSDLHVNLMNSSEHYYGVKKTLPKEKVENELLKFKRKKGFPKNKVEMLEYHFLKLSLNYLKTGITPLRCRSLSSSLFMDPYGDIYPCIIYNKKIANVKDIGFDLERLWQTKMVEDVRRVIKEKNCPNCWTPCEAYQSMLGNIFNTLITKNEKK